MPGFGALDALDCPDCQGKGTMFVTRRTPDPERPQYERQTFRCAKCQKPLERIVDEDGNPPSDAAVA